MSSSLLPSPALLSLPAASTPRPKISFSLSSSLYSSPRALSLSKAAQRAVLSPPRAADDAAADVEAVEEEGAEEEVSRIPKKPVVKLGDIMGILHKRAIEASDAERPIPDLRTGDIIEIKLEVPENRRRVSIYKGIVMSKQNAGVHTTIRVRRIIAGIGVEIVFPIYSPNVKEIKVVKHRKVRRARLYYLRDKLPRLSTFN